MFYFKLFSIAVLCLGFVFNCVLGSCQIRIENPRPVLWTTFGYKQILLSNSLMDINLSDGEEIHAECGTSISLFIRYSGTMKNDKSVTLYSRNDNCYYKFDNENEESYSSEYQAILKCEEGGSISLYESLKSLPNCLPYSSYGIGLPISPSEQMILVKSCFDLDLMKAKYVAYTSAGERKFTELTQVLTKSLTSSFNLEKRVSNIDLFWGTSSDTEFSDAYEKIRSANVFLRLFYFDYQGIIQDANIRDRLGGYEKMFKTIWWRNLREGIWQQYLNALREQSKMGTYEIFAGTSEDLIVPTNDCKKEDTLSMIINGTPFNAPRYIWNLVISKNYSTNEESIVVIGYNSPFENHLNETKFCKDMCSEIDWLNTEIIKKMRQLNSFGILQCCEPKDVISKLDGFPLIESDLKQFTRIEVGTTTTEAEVEEQNSTMNPERDY